MASDPRINSALFNFCLAADDGPRSAPDPAAATRATTSSEDIQWLRKAMESVELPDRATKRCLTTITDWFIPIREKLPMSTGSASAAAIAASGAAPLMLPAPRAQQQQQEQQQQQQCGQQPPKQDENENKQQQQQGSNNNSDAAAEEKRAAPCRIFLSDLPSEIPDQVLDAAEELCDLLEDLNYAREFMLLKGIRAYLDMLALAFDAANNSNGTSVLPNGASSESNKGEASDTAQLRATAKQWSDFRCILIRGLSGASANFDAFQTEMCKSNWAHVLVPQLTFSMRSNLVSVSTHEHNVPLRFVFPAETAALLLCVSNAMRAHGGALQMFLAADGMFHLANMIEFLRTVTDATFSCESYSAAAAALKNNHSDGASRRSAVSVPFRSAWLNALRRAFSASRYLVEEHGVTSQRVLRAAVDVVKKTSMELKRSKDGGEAAASAASADGEASYDTDDFSRDVQNAATAAAFASQTVTCALKRVLHQAAKEAGSNSNKSDIETLMPVWGKHMVEKLSGSWWEAVRHKKEKRGEQDDDSHHADLDQSVQLLVAELDELPKHLSFKL